MDERKRIFSGKLYSKNGFTLVEILATFVLIAIILPVAMEGISLSTRMASESRRKIEAGTLAEKKLTEITITRDWINGDQSGDFGNEYPEFKWRYKVSEWGKEELIRQIDLYVEWAAIKETHSVSVTTLVSLEDNSNAQ